MALKTFLGLDQPMFFIGSLPARMWYLGIYQGIACGIFLTTDFAQKNLPSCNKFLAVGMQCTA